MSLSVKHLNGDTTFLLTFSPIDQSQTPPAYPSRAGDFTILLDPWLAGDSAVFHPLFALSRHTVPSCVDHLSEIPRPNVVLISQDKPDHCHEETLRQLEPSLRHTVILAHPAAAKRIRGWKYFNPAKVHALPLYSAKEPQSIIRFHLPCSLLGGTPGEVTITLINAKRDITGLHNAIGLTYRAPSITSPFQPTRQTSYRHDFSSSAIDLPLQGTPLFETPHFFDALPLQGSPFLKTMPLTPPESPQSRSEFPSQPSSLPGTFSPHSASSSISSPLSTLSTQSPCVPATYTPFRPKTMSVIYSPHGVTYRYILPYVTSHLITNAALPLTLLLHAFDHVQNLWYLGGTISAGAQGGLEIAQNLLVKCWVSAHDEDKESSGISIKKLVTRKHTAREIQAMAAQGTGRGRARLDVRVLECGEEMVLRV
ncbi:hypothetical protein MMC13_001988 [Lambiella insularis]|nr:hypothetical protein [Lambiella insularis]